MNAVTGLYENRGKAQKAIEQLKGLGIQDENLYILSQQEAGKVSGLIDAHSESGAIKGVFVGALIGGTIGLIMGLTVIPITFTEISLLISGLVATLGGMAVGSFLGALYGARMAHNPKLQYKQQLANHEAVLLIAKTAPQHETEALQILKDTEGEYVDVHELDMEQFNVMARK